jgi:hypothetical protein
MKNPIRILPAAILVVLISACSLGAKPTGTVTPTVDTVSTQVAGTLTALAILAGPSATPVTPTLTPTPAPSETPRPTALPLPTLSFPTNTPLPVNVVACDNAAYVSDVTIPDGTVMAPGQTFTKTWKIKNTGTCTWTTAYKLAFVSGNAMGGVSTALTASVAPGGTIDISVALKAPSSAGSVTGYWRLKNAAGTGLGEQVSVVISVSGTTLTPTLTVTTTQGAATGTLTATVTPTETVTATPAAP